MEPLLAIPDINQYVGVTLTEKRGTRSLLSPIIIDPSPVACPLHPGATPDGREAFSEVIPCWPHPPIEGWLLREADPLLELIDEWIDLHQP